MQYFTVFTSITKSNDQLESIIHFISKAIYEPNVEALVLELSLTQTATKGLIL